MIDFLRLLACALKNNRASVPRQTLSIQARAYAGECIETLRDYMRGLVREVEVPVCTKDPEIGKIVVTSETRFIVPRRLRLHPRTGPLRAQGDPATRRRPRYQPGTAAASGRMPARHRRP
jgi:hypothetical protein